MEELKIATFESFDACEDKFDDKKPILSMLVGLPGSGKSTYSKTQKDFVIHSSDALREELYGDENCQDNNTDLFAILHSRIKTDLIDGKNVIYDATNIRLSELSLSYDLPKKWFKDRVGLTIGLTGRNLCMIYCKAPFDPEMTAAPRSNFYQGFDCFMTPATRSLGFNIRLRFQ